MTPPTKPARWLRRTLPRSAVGVLQGFLLLGLVACVRWSMLWDMGDGLVEVDERTGAEARVMDFTRTRFFGGTMHWVQVTVTASGGDRLVDLRIELPDNSREVPLRYSGQVSWIEDDLLITCPSEDFGGGEFQVRLRVPKPPR